MDKKFIGVYFKGSEEDEEVLSEEELWCFCWMLESSDEGGG